MDFTDDAIVLSTRRHGESDAILSALTRLNGRHLGLVKAGLSRRQRAVLEIGNRVKVVWRARVAEQLGNFQVESIASVAGALLDDPLRLAGLSAACAVADLVLPEREPHEDVFDATAALIDAIAEVGAAGVTPHPDHLPQGERGLTQSLAGSAPPTTSAIAAGGGATSPSPLEGEGRGEGSKALAAQAPWPAAYVRWELALLAALGFGLDLTHCAATGETTDLAYVSPKTGRAVGRVPGRAYADRLLQLPAFLIEPDAMPGSDDLIAGLRLTGYFLDRHVLHGPQVSRSATDRRLEARVRFLERLAARP